MLTKALLNARGSATCVHLLLSSWAAFCSGSRSASGTKNCVVSEDTWCLACTISPTPPSPPFDTYYKGFSRRFLIRAMAF